jgi:hypothetical protein
MLRVIRRLPSERPARSADGQASDKPQGRKPRAGIGMAVPRWNYGDLRATGNGLMRACRDGRWDGGMPLGEIAVAGHAGALNQSRLPSGV